MNTDNFKTEINTNGISRICKSCGGNLTKSESVYICDNCGEIYSQTKFLGMEFTAQNKGNLIMIIEDAFPIAGRGTVIAGETKSEISTGETVNINDVQYIVTEIKSFRKIISTAQAGTTVGLLLQNAVATSFKRGDGVYKKR